MDLKEVMKYTNFTVVGDVLNEEKYAYKIMSELIKNNYIVTTVTKQESLNDIDNIEVVNLCINPNIGLRLLKEFKGIIKVVLIQPGAESDELLAYLKEKEIPYLQGCSLVGMSLFKGN